MGDNNALLIKGSVFVKFQKSCIIKKHSKVQFI